MYGDVVVRKARKVGVGVNERTLTCGLAVVSRSLPAAGSRPPAASVVWQTASAAQWQAAPVEESLSWTRLSAPPQPLRTWKARSGDR